MTRNDFVTNLRIAGTALATLVYVEGAVTKSPPKYRIHRRGEEQGFLDEEGVARVLYRDGSVPSWIDVILLGEDDGHPVLGLDCSPTSIADDARLLYRGGDPRGVSPWLCAPPFQIGWPDVAGMLVRHGQGVRLPSWNDRVRHPGA